MDHGEDFLGFAHGEDGDEDGAFATEDLVDGVCEEVFFGFAGVVRAAGLCAAGGFDDEGVDGVCGEECAFLEGCVLEVDVAGVEDAFAFGLEGDADGAEDVSGVVEGGAEGACVVEVEGAFDVSGFEAGLEVVEFAVGEEGVFGDAKFHAFGLHDVDGVVEECGAEFGGFG